MVGAFLGKIFIVFSSAATGYTIVKLLVRGMLRTNFIGFLLLEKVPIRDE